MSEVFIGPGLLSGRITPPPSKSDAHRALICAALAGDPDCVQSLAEPLSDDLAATRACLAALPRPDAVLDCHESGTTLRLLLPVVAALGRDSWLIGRGRLPQRPLRDFEAILGGHGVVLTFPASGSLPLAVSGRLQPGTFAMPGNISSQYLSGLLLALPLLAGDSAIQLTTPLESAPYVDMTIRTMQRFGVTVVVSKPALPVYHVPGRQVYRPTPYQVERDYSQAAFWLTADFGRGRLKVEGLAADSCQGDRQIVDLLAGFAAGAAAGRDAYIIDASQIPDLVPILAVAATQVNAVTQIVNAARLRLKESDRLASTTAALTAIGADIRETADGLMIAGGSRSAFGPVLQGGTADSAGDHRITMALAVAALFSRTGVTIHGAECVRKSYPDFFSECQRLGGDVHGLHLG